MRALFFVIIDWGPGLASGSKTHTVQELEALEVITSTAAVHAYQYSTVAVDRAMIVTCIFDLWGTC